MVGRVQEVKELNRLYSRDKAELADIPSIYRITIDRATERKEKWGDRK